MSSVTTDSTFGPPTLIASDVDGTLIDDSNRVSEYTHDVLRRARDAGAEVVLATGRPPRWIAEVTDQFADTPPGSIPIIRYAVCANGAIIYDVESDRVLSAATLQPEALAKLGAMAVELIPDAGLAAERVGASAHDAATPPFVASAGYRHAWLNPDHIVVDDHDVYSEPSVKLLVRQPDLPSAEIAARLRPAVGDLAEVTFSTDNGLVELSVPATHKATGLRKLAQLKGLPTDAVIAFGDMPNDVEMLRWATHGVAMGHGHQSALAAADEVSSSNDDDGVARVLARWF
ncbi:HAD family hydrolase [Gordonia sp. TBRC 11910]|uniref:HAD family hydrolase n=1 Tax=Gordonia asplenii TaxID=2725283 RepID=A0A848L0V1_9ACTN|nr:HAD family hydrolase [Gordonia asplenii]NMO04329.1 HAD family hydrolase [Gordonia asplenii]